MIKNFSSCPNGKFRIKLTGEGGGQCYSFDATLKFREAFLKTDFERYYVDITELSEGT